jgi:hypothetical protein
MAQYPVLRRAQRLLNQQKMLQLRSLHAALLQMETSHLRDGTPKQMAKEQIMQQARPIRLLQAALFTPNGIQ